MQRFIVALAAAAVLTTAGCSNKAMKVNSSEPQAPAPAQAVTQTEPAPAAIAAPVEAPAAQVATAPGAPATTTGSDGAARITVDEASKAFKSGGAILVDVRTDEQYNTQHAKGSLHIPYAQLSTRLNEIPRGKFIILYCS